MGISSHLSIVTLIPNCRWVSLRSQRPTSAPSSSPFKLLSEGLFPFFKSTLSPPGSCKNWDHQWFSYPHSGGHGFTEFIVFYGSTGTVCCLQDWHYHTERGLGRVHTDHTPANQTRLTFTCTRLLTFDNTSGCFCLVKICDVLSWFLSTTEDKMQLIWSWSWWCIDWHPLFFCNCWLTI